MSFSSLKMVANSMVVSIDSLYIYIKNLLFLDTFPDDELQIFRDSLVVPPDFSNSPLLDIAENKGRVLKRNRLLRTADQAASKPISHFAETMDELETIDTGTPPSPFPELDEYVREFNTQYKRDVEIRSWTLLFMKCTNSMRVQYQLNNCRYCLRMQREHQSNNGKLDRLLNLMNLTFFSILDMSNRT